MIAVIFGVAILFLIVMGMFRLLYPATINIFNDLVIFYGSEFWAYFLITIFVLLVFATFLAVASLVIQLYINYRLGRF
jgi:hypothetical protein